MVSAYISGLRCASGGTPVEGVRYSEFSDWLWSLILQGYTLLGYCTRWRCMDARLVSDTGALPESADWRRQHGDVGDDFCPLGVEGVIVGSPPRVGRWA